jgi:hypothetical protein
MVNTQQREAVLSSMALLTSASTLVCCALPAILVAIGAGAAVAGLIGTVPQIVVLSEHKVLVFAVAGAMLAASGIFRYASRNAPCPADPGQAAACARLRKWGGVALYSSVALYGVGFFFAFLAAELL